MTARLDRLAAELEATRKQVLALEALVAQLRELADHLRREAEDGLRVMASYPAVARSAGCQFADQWAATLAAYPSLKPRELRAAPPPAIS